MSRRQSTILQSLFPSEEESALRMSMARTPRTRSRIRCWSRIETVAITTTLVGVTLLLVVAPVASITVAVWSAVSDVHHADLFWWIWGTSGAIPLAGVALWMLATTRRQTACFADGRVSVGTVEQAFEHPGSGDDRTWYDLRISAVLPDGSTLRRRLHLEGERLTGRVGEPVWFRHNTLDPDALDDVHFAGWPGAHANDNGRSR